MSDKELSEAYYKIADGYYALAEALAGKGADAAPTHTPERVKPPAPAPAPAPDDVDKTVCPKHLKPWTEGKYGPYCTHLDDDPAWSKNGYCRLTPKNAPDWLKVQRAA